ncbi:MAG TPA: aconitate hydratase, partial [Clostridiales bacterium]|nr:aconitate hydratase [Clostridiales bacterium]
NLINNGIIPMTFMNEENYGDIDEMDELVIDNLLIQLENKIITVDNITKNKKYKMELTLSQTQVEIIKSGGLLNYMALKNNVQRLK